MSGGSSGGDGGGSGFISLAISPDPGFTLDFEGLNGTEKLGRPFEYTLEVSSDTPKGDLTSVLGSSVTVTVTKPDKSKRYFNGIVTRIRFAGMVGGAYRYRLELRPWIWLLSRTQDCRIFQKPSQTIWDVITGVFRNNNFTDFSDQRQNQAGSQVLEYCVQYNETSLDFVTRLMEVYGIYYYFTHANGKHTLVLADDPNSHQSIGKAIAYSYKQTDYRTTDPHVWGWTSELTLQPGAATFTDYNFTTPSADLTGKSIQKGQHTYGDLEIYEYPGPHGVAADGTKLATVRAQRFGTERQTLQASSNSRDLYTGGKFTLSDFPDKAQNREYLIIEATYTVSGAESVQASGADQADSFRCAFSAIVGTSAFRLDGHTRWPTMRGPQTAKVVGKSGDEITTDQYGRIKVQFFWDRLGKNDENSSCWIRVAQMWTGTSWGSIYIPRVGQEVVVEFLDGSPDRPIVTGCVYNATNTVPYTLPDNMTRSTIKTNSSKGGGGFNELRFEDKKGSEEVYFQAQKDYNKLVNNNETVTVDKGNRSYTLNEGNNSFTISKGTNTFSVKGDNSATVTDGNNSFTVSKGNNTTTVSQGNDSLTVSQGNHSITVSAGSSSITAKQAITVQSDQSITLQVGSNSITIDTSGVTISGAKIGTSSTGNTQVQATGQLTLQGSMVNIN